MSNDIEEFLRRAAERRQQAARQRNAQQQAQTQTRPTPEYTDRVAERRVVLPVDVEGDDETVMAEIVDVEPPIVGGLAQRRDAERAARKLHDAQQVLAGLGPAQSLTQALTLQLQSPEGLRQAMLLREILDRPTHRW